MKSPTPQEDEQARQVLDKALHDLGEHFEAVQVLATRTAAGCTHTVMRGVGNWHARVGMAYEFIRKEDAHETAEQIASKLRPEE